MTVANLTTEKIYVERHATFTLIPVKSWEESRFILGYFYIVVKIRLEWSKFIKTWTFLKPSQLVNRLTVITKKKQKKRATMKFGSKQYETKG